jgi:hypothetical protein
MSAKTYITYECTRQTFRPSLNTPVRWLDWDQDYPLAQAMWPASSPLTQEIWREAQQQKYMYGALIEGQQIQAMAAVWKYSDTAWEVAAVRTRRGIRRRGYAKAVVSFVTAYILVGGRLATCSMAGDNIAMQRTAESIGFYLGTCKL